MNTRDRTPSTSTVNPSAARCTTGTWLPAGTPRVAVQWRAYQHLLTLKPYALSWKRQETHPGWNLLWENFEALLEPHVIPPVPTSTPDLPSLRGPAAVIAARIAAAAVTSASHIVARQALSHTSLRRSDEDIAEEKYFNGLALAAANLE